MSRHLCAAEDSLVGAGMFRVFFFFQAEDGIRDYKVTGVQTCALPISFWSLKAGMRQITVASTRCGISKFEGPRSFRRLRPSWAKLWSLACCSGVKSEASSIDLEKV